MGTWSDQDRILLTTERADALSGGAAAPDELTALAAHVCTHVELLSVLIHARGYADPMIPEMWRNLLVSTRQLRRALP